MQRAESQLPATSSRAASAEEQESPKEYVGFSLSLLSTIVGPLTSTFLQDMKAQCISHCLLGMTLILYSVRTHSLRRCLISVDTRPIQKSFQEIRRALQTKDTFPNITILSTLQNLKTIKPVDVCCMTNNLLTFYQDRVFKDHQELNTHILRSISSIANSFLYVQKTLQQCQGQRWCQCSQEATNATRIIHDNYSQLEVRSAAIKSLGELDIFLSWIDKNHQETSAT